MKNITKSIIIGLLFCVARNLHAQVAFELSDTFSLTITNVVKTTQTIQTIKLTRFSPSEALVQDFIVVPCGASTCRQLQREFYVNMIHVDYLINQTVSNFSYGLLTANKGPELSSYYAISFLDNNKNWHYDEYTNIAYKDSIVDKFYAHRMKFKDDK